MGSWRGLGAILEEVERFSVESSWGLGRTFGDLGGFLKGLRVILEGFGGNWHGSWGVLVDFGWILEGSWGVLEDFWGILGDLGNF